MIRQSLYFSSKGIVEIRDENIPEVRKNEVMVKTMYSGISAGTEMLIYKGLAPENMVADEVISGLGENLKFPLKYGYSSVGEIVQVGNEVDNAWQGKKVFAFNPHETHFVTSLDNLLLIPEDVKLKDAVFLPNMETAVNFLMDGKPQLGEKVVVLGQGIVGLLTTALLVKYPLKILLSLDSYPLRQKTSEELGAYRCFDSMISTSLELMRSELDQDEYSGADLIFELSGNPVALNTAIDLAGFHSRIVIGSWYGQKQANINLGGRFHRQRINLISSQVSTLTPELSGRWNKKRRFEVVWQSIRELNPSRLITHKYSFSEASKAYASLDNSPEDILQVIFEY